MIHLINLKFYINVNLITQGIYSIVIRNFINVKTHFYFSCGLYK